jgi:hypothetical protein
MNKFHREHPYDPQLRGRLEHYIAAGKAGTLATQVEYDDLRELADLAQEAADHLNAAAIDASS